MKMRSVMAWIAVMACVVVLAGCGPTMVTKYDVADRQKNDGQFAEAIQSYQEFIAQNSESALVPFAMYNIGLSYQSLGDANAAMAAFKDLVAKYPTSDQAQWAEAEMRKMEKPAE